MTNKEAKEKLYMEWQKFLEDNIDYGGISEAYKMAFKALEQEPCDDAISREAVLSMQYRIDDSSTLSMRDVVNVDDIEGLPSVTPQPKWIPVTERLPETNGRYLVTRGLNACDSIWNRTYIINYSDLMGLKSERIWWDGNVGKSDFERFDDVIAWMPLPERYES